MMIKCLSARKPDTVSILQQMSGWTIRHNTFVDCQVGTWIGGGRRNTVVLNRYEKCDTAVHIDNRGTRGGAKRADQCDVICEPLSADCTCNTGAAQWMATASSAAATWRARWPFLLSIRSERLGQPAYNNISSYIRKCRKVPRNGQTV